MRLQSSSILFKISYLNLMITHFWKKKLIRIFPAKCMTLSKIRLIRGNLFTKKRATIVINCFKRLVVEIGNIPKIQKKI